MGKIRRWPQGLIYPMTCDRLKGPVAVNLISKEEDDESVEIYEIIVLIARKLQCYHRVCGSESFPVSIIFR